MTVGSLPSANIPSLRHENPVKQNRKGSPERESTPERRGRERHNRGTFLKGPWLILHSAGHPEAAWGKRAGEPSVKRLAKSHRTLKVVREGGPCPAQLLLEAVTHPSPSTGEE